MPRLSRIAIYPLKSFDTQSVESIAVLPNGALRHDRQFALVDETGRIINAKRTPVVHRLQLNLDPATRTLTARRRADSATQQWSIDAQREDAERWLGSEFGCRVSLVERNDGGFPDDEQAPGPTIVSTATLEKVASWFPSLTVDDVRTRFRANLEIDADEAFWEDHLFRDAESVRRFQIGDVLFGGTNPCQRCVVPSRDPHSGDVTPDFARTFTQMRELHLPTWAARERFDHFYRLAVNTRLIEAGCGILRVADDVQLLD